VKGQPFTRRAALAGIAGAVILPAAARAQSAPVQSGPAQSGPVQIEYWQYFFKERVTAMDELIRRFQAVNPGVTVKQTTFPYDQYRTKVAAAIPAGAGPDVVQLYYGWLRDYRRAKLIDPLPADAFPAAEIERDFYPIVRQMQADGAYYALPTAVRTMGLFTNRRLMAEAGLDPDKPPSTLDAHLADAIAMARRDSAGNLVTAGTTIGLPSQDSHWWREVLVRQFGGRPFSDDYRNVLYGTPEGAAALQWYADLQLKHQVAQVGFLSEAAPAFRSGHVGLLINASFLVGTLQATKGLDWGVGDLPERNGIRANYASYWANALVAGSTGAKREAALKFLHFITSDDAMAYWTTATGELPARPSVAQRPAIQSDKILGGFAHGLADAYATDFVDEDAQRAVFVEMLDRVLLKGQSPADSVREAAAAEQKIIDNYYKS
jgi:multiple sugar transport system substrate-binding protein